MGMRSRRGFHSKSQKTLAHQCAKDGKYKNLEFVGYKYGNGWDTSAPKLYRCADCAPKPSVWR